jgi:pimeloyl-ACP methyl ester carboxylesterase
MADHRIPLVLLHGFPMDGRIWDDQVNGLADVALVTPVDLFNLRAARAGPFSIDDLADGVHRVVGDADQPCVLGGLSMGGYVALSVADRYPADVRGLVLFDTKATADDAAARRGRDAMIDLARTGGTEAVADAMLPKLLSPRAPSDVVDAMRRIMTSLRPDTIAHALAAMRDRPDRTGVLARIAVPTLAIVGADDGPTPPAVVDAMRRQIRGAELAVIPDAGHVTPIEQPTAVNDALRRFLASLA